MATTTHVRPVDGVALAELLASATTPVLVDYTASWCPPCQALAPILDEVAVEQAERLTIVSVDVDAHPDVAGRAGIMSMPTLVLYVDGQEARRLVGARGKGRLLEDLDGAI